MTKERLYPFILIILALLLFSYLLGGYSFWDNDEPLYTQIAREIIKTGDWLTLHWNGEIWLCHPPLYMWLTAITSKLLGWNEFCARFWPTLFGIGLVLLTYFLGSKLYNQKVGFIAALILMTSLEFFVQSKMATLDTCFTFFMALSILLFYCGFSDNKNAKWYNYFFWLSCSLATLAKGPFGLVLPLGLSFLYLLFSKRLNEFKKMFSLIGITLYLLIGGFWYIAGLVIQGQTFFEEIFLYFTLNRVTTPILNQSGPWYYYFLVFLVGFFPWIAFVFESSKKYYKERKLSESIFLLIWVIVPFVFFTLVQTKLPNYILIIYPACAVIVAKTLYDQIFVSFNKRSIRISLIILTILNFIIILAFIILALQKFPQEYKTFALSLIPLPTVIIATVILSWLLYFFKRPKVIVSVIFILTFTLYLILTNLVVKVDQFKPMKPLALQLKNIKAGSEPVAAFSKVHGKYSLVFYLNEKVDFLDNLRELRNFMNQKQKVFCLTNKKTYKGLTKRIQPNYPVLEYQGYVIFSNKK